MTAAATTPPRSGLAARIIPCLDVADGRVVKGVQFQNLSDQGDPAECALRYADQGADEIVFLDIGAAPERRDTDLDWVRRTAEQVFVPLSVGGGVRSVEDGRRLLLAGADKIGVNTAAWARPQLLTDLAERFGSQCVVLSVDARRSSEVSPRTAGAGRRANPRLGGSTPQSLTRKSQARGPEATSDGEESPEESRWEVVTHGGRQGTGGDVIEWIDRATDLGAGEILLTSIDSDGTRDGYDLDLIARVVERVGVPVIASGGAGNIEHLAEALAVGAAAVLAASIFHQSSYSVGEVKRQLADRFPMRLEKGDR